LKGVKEAKEVKEVKPLLLIAFRPADTLDICSGDISVLPLRPI